MYAIRSYYVITSYSIHYTKLSARHHVNITMCKAKANGNYMNSILAHQEAAADGYDEALLLDVDGFVAEGSGSYNFV